MRGPRRRGQGAASIIQPGVTSRNVGLARRGWSRPAFPTTQTPATRSGCRRRLHASKGGLPKGWGSCLPSNASKGGFLARQARPKSHLSMHVWAFRFGEATKTYLSMHEPPLRTDSPQPIPSGRHVTGASQGKIKPTLPTRPRPAKQRLTGSRVVLEGRESRAAGSETTPRYPACRTEASVAG